MVQDLMGDEDDYGDEDEYGDEGANAGSSKKKGKVRV